MSHSTCRKSLTAIAKGDGIIEFGSRFFAKSQGPAAEGLGVLAKGHGLLASTSIYAGYGIMAKGKGSFSFCLSTFPKGRRSNTGRFINQRNFSIFFVCIVFSAKSSSIVVRCPSILANDRGTFAFCLGIVADGHGIFRILRSRGADPGRYGIITLSASIIVVVITSFISFSCSFYAVVMYTVNSNRATPTIRNCLCYGIELATINSICRRS